MLISLLVLLLCHTGAWAHSVNVLIVKHAARVNLSFAQNYAIVIGKHFYGPVSAKNQLQLVSTSKGIQITVANAKTKIRRPLTTTREPIHLVRSLGTSVNFRWPTPMSALKKKPLPPFLKWQQFPAQRGEFATIRHPAFGGDITYNGPLTVFQKSGINIVETAELEDYVTHVVNCELGSETSIHALKAQSIMARTFALYMVQDRLQALESGNLNWQFFQLRSSTSDQAYNCRKRVNDQELPNDLVKRATRETAGLVLLKNNELAKVHYNATIAGKDTISQAEVVKRARAGRSYKNILQSFVPGSRIGRYNLSAVCTQAVKALFRNNSYNKRASK